MIDARGLTHTGAAATGTLTVLRGEEARALNDEIARKYLTEAGLAHPDVGGRIRVTDDVTIRLDPHRWRTWSVVDDLGGVAAEPGIQLPLDG